MTDINKTDNGYRAETQPDPAGRPADDREERPEETELPAGPGGGVKSGSLLDRVKPTTATANKKVVVGVAMVFVAVIAISFTVALTPESQKKKTEDSAKQQDKQESNRPVDDQSKGVNMVAESMKGTGYDQTQQGQPQPVIGQPDPLPAGVPRIGPPQNTILPGAVPAPVPGNIPPPPSGAPSVGTYSVQAPPPGPILPTLEDDRRMRESERRAKIEESARKSAVKFGVGGAKSAAVADNPPGGFSPEKLLSSLLPVTAQAGGNPAQSGGGTGGQNQDPNQQSEKENFLSKKRENDSYLTKNLNLPLSKYEVKAGSIIPITLITEMNTDLPGHVTAQVRENVWDSRTGRYLLIPQGTRVTGEYDSKVTFGQNRALIVWTRLIFPNGMSLNLEGMPGVDLSGAAGYKDLVDHHLLRIAGSAILSSFMSVGVAVAGGPSSADNPTIQGQAAQGAAQGINNTGQTIIRKNIDLQPTIRIRKGTRVNIFVHRDMILVPYRG